jgi:fucose permease
MLRTTLLTSMLATGAQGGYYAVTTFLPTFLKTVRKLSVLNTGAYTFVAIVGAWVGYMVSAYLCDYLGRRKTLIVYAVCSAITVTCYTFLPISNGVMLVLGFPLGFFVAGMFSPIGPFFTELFPSRLRGSGQGFAYNFGRGVGALFPTLVGFLAARITLGTAIAVFGVAAYVVLIIAVLALPETKGKALKAYE